MRSPAPHRRSCSISSSAIRIACEARRNGTLRAAVRPAACGRDAHHGRATRAPRRAGRAAGGRRHFGVDRHRPLRGRHARSARRGSQSIELCARPGAGGDRRGGGVARRHAGAGMRRGGGRLAARGRERLRVAPHVVLATNGYTDGLWPDLRRTIVPLFGAIAATAALPETAARAIMPSRSVLYESGTITVYYRIDSRPAPADRRPRTDARDPFRQRPSRICSPTPAGSGRFSRG